LQHIFGISVGAVSQVLKSTLEHVPVAECYGQGLDLVGDLVHPNIEECLTILHNLLLEQFA